MARFLKITNSDPLRRRLSLEIISAAILGLLVFQDFPNTLTWAGIAIIVSSGLYIIHRERLTEKGKVRLKVPAEL